MAESKIQLETGFNLEGLVKELQNSRNEADKLRTELVSMNQQVKQGFDATGASAGKMSTELQNALSKISTQVKVIDDLNDELEQFRKNNTGAFDTTRLKQYEEQIKHLQTELDNLRKKSQPVGAGITDIGKRVDQTRAAMQQIIREVPAMGNGFQTFIMAIGNNIGALQDSIGRLKKENLELAASGQKPVSMFKTLVGSIFNWQTALLVGITLLITFGKEISDWTKNLFKGKDALDVVATKLKAYHDLQTQVADTYGKQKAELDSLIISLRTEGISQQERAAIIDELRKKFPDYFNDIKTEADLHDKLDIAVRKASEALMLKARVQSATALIGANETKRLQAELTYQEEITKTIQTLNKALANSDERGNIAAAAQRNAARAEARERAKELAKDYEQVSKEVAASNEFLYNSIKNANEKIVELGGKVIDTSKVDERLKDERRKAEARNKREAAEREKALKEEEERLRRIAELEKQLAQLRIDAMQEGRLKDIAQENARFDAAINSLNLLLKAEKTSAEERNLINKQIEQQRIVHTSNLLKIDRRYQDDALKTFQAVYLRLNEILHDGRMKELEKVNADYIKLKSDIDEAMKKIDETGDSSIGNKIRKGLLASQRAEIVDDERRKAAAVNAKWDEKLLQDEQQVAKASIEAININGAHELEMIELKERLKLEVELDYAKKRLDNLKKHYDSEGQLTETAINKLSDSKTFEAAQALGVDVFEYLGIEISDEDAKEKILNAIASVRKAGNAIIESDKKKKTDLFEALGIDADTKKDIENVAAGATALGRVAGDAMQPFIDGIERQIEARQRLIEKIEQQIDAQRNAVDEERAIAERGDANNLQLAEQRLKALEEQRNKELEQEKKLREERAKIQRAQIIADSFAQASNLITSSTEIYKALSPLGPVGVGLASVAIGAMLAGFIAAKVQAFRATSDVQQFEKGGTYDILKGRASHKEGGVVLVERKTGNELAEFEGDEKLFIVNKGSSKKYESMLNAINKDELSNWTYDDLKKFINPTSIKFNREQSLASSEKANVNIVNTTIVQPMTNAERLLADIADTNKKLLDIEKERATVIEDEEKKVVIAHNFKRTIFKKSSND